MLHLRTAAWFLIRSTSCPVMTDQRSILEVYDFATLSMFLVSIFLTSIIERSLPHQLIVHNHSPPPPRTETFLSRQAWKKLFRFSIRINSKTRGAFINTIRHVSHISHTTVLHLGRRNSTFSARGCRESRYDIHRMTFYEQRNAVKEMAMST